MNDIIADMLARIKNAQKVYKACGIVLGPHKREMVYSRLARRIRANQLDSFSSYLSFLEENEEQEFSQFINAITTNLTSFFRENHHFERGRRTHRRTDTRTNSNLRASYTIAPFGGN